MNNINSEREYFLSTERTLFSKWTENDGELAVLLWGDPEVTRLICASGVFSKSEIYDRLQKEISNEKLYGVQYWPFFDRESQALIGCCGLRPHGDKEYEMGFHLRPDYWHKGLGEEAAKAVLTYAFRELNARKVVAGHNPKNEPSKKLITKLGFSYTGDSFYEPTGLFHPSYEILPESTKD